MKHMKLIVLLAAAMMVQGAQASSKMDDAKRVGKSAAKVTWHTAQTATGIAAVIIGRLVYKEANGSTKMEKLNDEKGLLALLSVGAISLLNSGIRGLNRDFKLVERAKKLAAHIMKEKK